MDIYFALKTNSDFVTEIDFLFFINKPNSLQFATSDDIGIRVNSVETIKLYT